MDWIPTGNHRAYEWFPVWRNPKRKRIVHNPQTAYDTLDFPVDEYTAPRALREEWFAGIAYGALRLRKGQQLYREEDFAQSVFVVRRGTFMLRARFSDGGQHVLGFCIEGDYLGLDGLSTGWHQSNAIALESSEVYVLPYLALSSADHEDRSIGARLAEVLKIECTRRESVRARLLTMQADERVAYFLLDLCERYEARGMYSSRFRLCMSDTDIGDYLSLRPTAVTRSVNYLARSGLIALHADRGVSILNPSVLRASLPWDLRNV